MVILNRKSWSPIFAILIPSIIISPSAASLIRNKPKVSEDFPAPVLPTIPICWEEIQEQLTPRNSYSISKHLLETDTFSEGCHICWAINTPKQHNKLRLIKREEKKISLDMKKTRTKSSLKTCNPITVFNFPRKADGIG